jgi:hypothetical protein
MRPTKSHICPKCGSKLLDPKFCNGKFIHVPSEDGDGFGYDWGCFHTEWQNQEHVVWTCRCGYSVILPPRDAKVRQSVDTKVYR